MIDLGPVGDGAIGRVKSSDGNSWAHVCETDDAAQLSEVSIKMSKWEFVANALQEILPLPRKETTTAASYGRRGGLMKPAATGD